MIKLYITYAKTYSVQNRNNLIFYLNDIHVLKSQIH